jgi:hypothetical protein
MSKESLNHLSTGQIAARRHSMKDRPFRTALMVCLQLTIILVLVFFASPSDAKYKQVRKRPKASQPSRTVLESEGLTYVYQTMSVETLQKRYDFPGDVGRITISESVPGGNIVYEEKYGSRPGCDRFPTVSRFPTKADIGAEWFVVACGGDYGRHETIKAFVRGTTALEIRTTSLDFENSFPNLMYDSHHGFYTAKVYKRVFMDGVGYGTVEYATAYRLLMDGTVFGFVPVFGAPMERFYLDYYVELKDGILRRKAASAKEPDHEDDAGLIGDYVGPMLGALFATENANRICSERKVFESFGLTLQDLRAWRKRLVNVGYPDFNFDNCREVAK